jgi:para-nitrobenzyl esterase
LSDVQRRLQRFLDTDEATIDRIVRDYQAAAASSDPSSLMIAITTDQIFKRSTYDIAVRWAASARAPVYAYVFAWETPIEGGRMRSPHTVEVPFVFGTVDAAPGCVGTGTDLNGMSNMMMSVWATFARTGNPTVAELPQWDPYDGDGQKMMILNVESRLERDPGAATRASLEALPFFGNRNPISALAND